VIDVAIVGGGPAGLLAAIRLAESGLDVVVFEEHARIGDPVHCTGIVSLEAADFVKIPDDLVLGRVRRATILGPDATRAGVEWRGTDAEEIVAIDRGEFDRRLAQQAVDAGATVLTGSRVDEVIPSATSVDVRLAGHRLAARACVIACGVSYRLQRRLGLGLPGRVVHTAQVEVDAESADHVGIHFGRDVAPGGFLWTVPLVRAGRPRMKVGVMGQGDAAGHLRRFLEGACLAWRRYEPGDGVVRRLLPLRPLPKTYTDRVLVVGDAGGFTKPTTGGGIFYSLVTASLAAGTLLEAFSEERFDDGFLSRYERAWQARIGHELRAGDWLRGLVGDCTDAHIATFVRALAADDVQSLIARMARFNWHRDLILAFARQRGMASLVFHSLLR
jgi:digeranylgeranylglycerophospholipid reductase